MKPSNLFLVGGDLALVKVLDFGIAAMAGATSLTRSGAMVGTPSYMAPEQIRSRKGESVDSRTDVFALGCVLMECLTGEPVFKGDHPFAIMAKIIMQQPPRLREVRPGIPRELDSFVLQMLSKDPNGRPRDGAAVAAALRNIRNQHLPTGVT
ncbi:MAG: serine/threonine protein kinase [Polyangiaceae bacterium]|nr:serine/threonine protein kinase [Polyangiaceae bacterium]